MDHLWYLSERLVPFCLFSDNANTLVNTLEKQRVRQCLPKSVSGEMSCLELSIPEFDPKKSSTYQLQDFVGPDSWTFLKLISSMYDISEASTSGAPFNNDALKFLNVHPSKWNSMPNYLFVKKQVLSLTVVNDVAERSLALITEFDNHNVPKNEDQKQYLFKVIKEMRAIQSKNTNGSERVTKDSMSKTTYEWS